MAEYDPMPNEPAKTVQTQNANNIPHRPDNKLESRRKRRWINENRYSSE
jgi:hypothetical protein